MGDIVLTGSGDFSKLKQEFDKLQRENLKQEQQLRKLTSLSREAETGEKRRAQAATDASKNVADGIGKGNAALREGLATIGKYAMGLVGISTAMAGIRNEVNAMLAAQKRAADASISVADTQVKALRNLGATTKKERDEFTTAIDKMSAETGVSARDLYLRASSALSAKGELPQSAAMAAVRLSARLVPESQEEGTVVAGAALDLMKMMGTTDPREAMGVLMGIGQKARVTDIGQLSEHAAPALKGIIARGGSVEEAGALYAALTQGIGDVTGRISGTAGIQLATQLASMLPEEDRYAIKKIRGQDRRVLEAKGTGLKTTAERLEFLRTHERERMRFLSEASFEVKARAPIEELISGRGSTFASYQEFLRTMPSRETAAADFEERLRLQRTTREQQVAGFKRGVTAAKEQLAMADTRQAMLGVIREEMSQALEQSGQSWAVTKLDELRALPAADLGPFIEQIGERETALRKTAAASAALGYTDRQVVEMRRAEALRVLGRKIQEANLSRGDAESAWQSELAPTATTGQPPLIVVPRKTGNFFRDLEAAKEEAAGGAAGGGAAGGGGPPGGVPTSDRQAAAQRSEQTRLLAEIARSSKNRPPPGAQAAFTERTA